jgi:phytoene dehydrogenase-like protein
MAAAGAGAAGAGAAGAGAAGAGAAGAGAAGAGANAAAHTRAYDAIVVGGGHNGLVAAAYLARSGARTLVLESRGHTGGAATTEAPWPDAPEFRVTRLSYVMSLMPPTIINDLDLARHGYKIYPMGPYYQAFPEGGSIKLYADDAQRNHEEVSRWSKKDADAMPRWDAWLAGLADVLGPLLLTVPPRIGSHKPSDLASTLRLAWRQRGLDVRTIADVTRLMTMSIADLLDDWFESPQVKGALAVNGVIGTWAGPCEPGTAYVMAHHSIGDVGDGHLGNWGFQEGGMGAVADTIARAAREHGAQIRTGARVERLLISGGHVAGVVLDSGEEIRATTVVTSLHPRTAFLDQVGRENLPDDFVSDIERWRSRSGVVKINLALAELPDFTANPGTNLQEHHTGSVEMAPTVEYIERAFQDAREGRAALRPFSDGVIPTAFDKTLSPAGTHIMSLFTQWVPADWNEQPHREELQAYADRMIDCYNELAPNFKRSILHTDIVGPYDMEHDYGLIGGNIFHGELSLEQLFHMRPAPGYADYRTPVAGLYYASSATHGGGGVCGIPGWQAARAAIADAKSARRSSQLRRLARRP